MLDEVETLRKIGVDAMPCFVSITLYKKSSRLSALWHANTSTIHGAARLGVLALPNDEVKRRRVEERMEERKKLVDKIRRELDSQGVCGDANGN